MIPRPTDNPAGTLWDAPAKPALNAQASRVLAALRRGPVGTIDGIRADLGDGGAPILRLAARTHELRKAGYVIESALTGPGGTAVYALKGERR